MRGFPACLYTDDVSYINDAVEGGRRTEWLETIQKCCDQKGGSRAQIIADLIVICIGIRLAGNATYKNCLSLEGETTDIYHDVSLHQHIVDAVI